MGRVTLPVYLNQAIISGGNFVVGLFLVRTLGLEQFGQYAMLFVALLLLSTTHNALFSAPMFTIAPAFSTKASKAYMASLNLLQAGVGVAIFVSVLLLSTMVGWWWPDVSEHLWWFAAACACVPIQEWQRRYLIACGKLVDAVVYDGFRIAVWLIGLSILYLKGQLTVTGALQILALSSGLVYLMSFLGTTPGFSTSTVAATVRRNWIHARHLMPSYQLEWAGLQGFLIVAGLLLGPQFAGAIRAAQNILGPLNIVYQAADNIYPTRGARILMAHGFAATRAYFSRAVSFGVPLLAVPCGVIAFFADEVIVLVYGQQMLAHGSLVIWQAISLLLGFALKLLSAHLRVLGKTRPILISTLISVSVTYLLIYPLGAMLFANGIMVAKLLAESIAIGFAAYALTGAIKTSRVDEPG